MPRAYNTQNISIPIDISYCVKFQKLTDQKINRYWYENSIKTCPL